MSKTTDIQYPPVGDDAVQAVHQFLGREAMLLDDRRFWDWFALLDDSIVYEVLIRSVREFGAPEVVSGAYRQRDDKHMLDTRIKRLYSGSAWAEDPPSRTVRNVGSVFVQATSDPSVVEVGSALLLYRHRAQDEHGDLISARRNDRIRFTEQGPLLLARTVLLADTVLTTPNLAVFL